MRKYDSYKDSGVEWIGEIPSHWDIKRVREHTTIIQGYPFSSDKFNYEENGYPLIRIRDLISSNIETYYSGKYVDSAEINNGDILVGMDGDFNNVIWKGGKALLNQRICKIDTLNSVDKDFFKYILDKPLKIINDLTYFTTVKHLSIYDVQKIKFPLPSKKEQKHIAKYLDNKTSEIDNLISSKEELIETLKKYRQSLITEVVTKGIDPNVKMKDSGVEWIGEIPQHWKVTKLKYILNINPNKSEIKNKFEKDTKVSFVPMEKVISTGNIDLSLTKEMSEVYDGYTYFKDEDIIMAKVTPCFENDNTAIAKGLYNGIGFGSSELYVLRVNEGIDNRFIYYLIQSNDFKSLGQGSMYGAGGLKRVPSSFIENFELAIPNQDEQIKICDYLDNKIDEISGLSKTINDQIQTLKDYRQSLIFEAVTGKIDVREE